MLFMRKSCQTPDKVLIFWSITCIITLGLLLIDSRILAGKISGVRGKAPLVHAMFDGIFGKRECVDGNINTRMKKLRRSVPPFYRMPEGDAPTSHRPQ